MKKNILIAIILLACSPLPAEPLDEAKKAYRQSQYEKTIEILDPLAQAEAKDAEIFLLLGHATAKLEKWPQAIAAFEKAAELDPASLAAHLQLGFLYEKTKEPEKAKAAWQKVLSLAKNEKTKKLAQKHLINLK
ncbi:MAG: tetratricopeptide repeat protein [Elusimicrobiota bacterium]